MTTKPYIINQVGDTLNLLINGDISNFWGVGLTEISDQIKAANPSRILVQINSGGGDLLEAQAIASFLKGYSAKVDTTGLGLVASAATVILLAGENVSMSDNSWFMIHNPSAEMQGGSNDLRKTADLLDEMQSNLADIYVSAMQKNGKITDNAEAKKKEVIKMMNAETWLTAAQAKEQGFISNVVQGAEFLNKQAAVQYLNSCKTFKNAPKEFLNQLKNIINMPNEQKEETSLWDSFKAFFRSKPSEVKAMLVEIQNDVEAEKLAEIEKAKQIAKGHGFYKEETTEEVAAVVETIEVPAVAVENSTVNAEAETLKAKIKELEERLGAPSAGADKAQIVDKAILNKEKIYAPTEHHKEAIAAFTNIFK